MTYQKIVLVTKKTRLEELIFRYNTLAQAKFYIESLGVDFQIYLREHQAYRKALLEVEGILSGYGKLHCLDRNFLPNFIFGKQDLVVVLGNDGLVVNTLKYLSDHPLIGVNPDPEQPGLLLPFNIEDLKGIIPQVLRRQRPIKSITMAKVTLSDKQVLYAVNDFFIGHRSHVSARYEIHYEGKMENHSSSGLIVSTGFGSTGWLKSVLVGASKIASFFLKEEILMEKKMDWAADSLFFSVREPFPSSMTQAEIVFGEISHSEPLTIVSQMPENGVIFSDGIEKDYLVFNAGMKANFEIAEKKGNLVV